MVAMDSNARHKFWDEEVTASCINKKMGDVLVEVILDNHMEVLSDGTHTYHKDDYSAALDLTVVKGLQKLYPIKWTVFDDDINSDHSPIPTEVGVSGSGVVTLRKDWSNMDWHKYEEQSAEVLVELLE